MRAPRSSPSLLAALFALVLAASVTAIAWDLGSRGHPFALPLDDAYIYLQYARTAAQGDPGSYAPGESRSAGATSLLWLMDITKTAGFLAAQGADLETALPAAVMMGCGIALAVSLWLLFRLGVRLGVSPLLAPLSCLLILVSPLSIFGSMNGMETGLYGTALLGGAWFASGGSALWLLPLALVRPEGALLALVLLAGRFAADPSFRARPSAWKNIAVIAAAILCLVYPWLFTGGPAAAWEAKALRLEPKAEVRDFYVTRLPYFAGRSLWFGLSGARMQPPLDLAGTLFRAGAWPIWASAFFLGTGALLAILGRRGRILTFLWVVASLGALLSVAWDAHFYRYLVPAYPLLCAAAVAGWFGGQRKRRRAVVGGTLLVLVLVGTFLGPGGLGPTMRRLYRGECERLESTQLRIGHWIAEHLDPSARVATHDVGAIAWAGKRPVVDLVGLVTPAMAGAYRHGEGALWESLDALPTEARPTHMAIIPAWMPYLFRTDLFVHRLFALESAAENRSPVGQTFEIWTISWPAQNPGAFPGGDFGNTPYSYGPMSQHPSWSVIDELDVAHLTSEAQHGFHTDLGNGVTVVRELGFGFPSQGVFAAAIEGGRDIAGTTRFTLRAEPEAQALLLLRATSLERPELVVRIGTWTGLLRMGRNEQIFQETGVLVPGQVVTERLQVQVEGKGYRAYHWWLLQHTRTESE